RKVVAAIAILPESDCYRDHSLAGMLLHPPQIAGKVIERLIKPAIIDDTPKLIVMALEPSRELFHDMVSKARNPQVDLEAHEHAHRSGKKKEVQLLRF
ncbi:hypothetical protein Tco_0514990, partial [Tanacetum coccineum]